jgi:hypothetical protein
MEDIIMEELNSLARDVIRNNVNSKFKPVDILHALKDDPKKHARAVELVWRWFVEVIESPQRCRHTAQRC